MTNKERRKTNQMLWLMVGGWMLVLTTLAHAAPAHGADLVTLKPSHSVDGADVMLSDVFDGVDPTLDRTIARSPHPGKKITYDVNVLQRVAQMYRLGWRPATFADAITLTRAANTIDAGMISAALVEALRAQGVEGELDIALDRRTLKIDLPTDTAPDFSLNNVQHDATTHRFSADMVIAANTANAQNISVTGRVLAKIAVPVLTRPLNAGDIIGASDLTTIMLPADRTNATIRAEADLIGKATRRALTANLPIRPGDIMPPRLVQRGTLVTIVIASPVMRLTAQGRALQDGAEGETIKVVNTQSNRLIQATVTGAGLVTVTTAPAPTQTASFTPAGVTP